MDKAAIRKEAAAAGDWARRLTEDDTTVDEHNEAYDGLAQSCRSILALMADSPEPR